MKNFIGGINTRLDKIPKEIKELRSKNEGGAANSNSKDDNDEGDGNGDQAEDDSEKKDNEEENDKNEDDKRKEDTNMIENGLEDIKNLECGEENEDGGKQKIRTPRRRDFCRRKKNLVFCRRKRTKRKKIVSMRLRSPYTSNFGSSEDKLKESSMEKGGNCCDYIDPPSFILTSQI